LRVPFNLFEGIKKSHPYLNPLPPTSLLTSTFTMIIFNLKKEILQKSH